MGEGERAAGAVVTEGLMDTGSCGELVVLVCRGGKQRGEGIRRGRASEEETKD